VAGVDQVKATIGKTKLTSALGAGFEEGLGIRVEAVG
jgi:hypothetical protein